MSWFQENKFAGTVMGLTAVVSGALVYLGFTARSEANQASQRELAAVQKINSLQSTITHPNDSNKNKLNDNLLKYVSDAKGFQDELVKYRPSELKKLSPDEFNSEVSNYFKKLDNMYKEKNVLFTTGESQHYGMGKYAGPMAQETDTAYLSYNRRALEWLFSELAASGAKSVDHVHRKLVAEKLSSPKVEPKTTKKGKKAKPVVEAMSISDVLPIELTFTGSESNLQTFLTKVADSDEYFFALKLLKIKNEKGSPVSLSQMTFAKEVELGVSDDLSPDDDLPSLDDGSDDFAEDKTIMKQVVGSENITVFVQFDLHLFKDPSTVVIPRAEDLASSAKLPVKK